MGNTNTCVLVQVSHCKRAAGITVGADGAVLDGDMRRIADLLQPCDSGVREWPCDLPVARVTVLHGARMRLDAERHAPEDAQFRLDHAALDQLLLRMHADGLGTARVRRLAVQVLTNVRAADLRALGVAMQCVLRECGVRRWLWTGETRYIDDAQLFRTPCGSRWPQPVAVCIEAHAAVDVPGVGAARVPLLRLPVVFSGADLLETPLGDTLQRLLGMLAALPAHAEFTVRVLFDALYPEALADAARRAVFFFADTPLQRRVEALAAGAGRGRLRRTRLPVLHDVYRVHVVTNACGPHVPAFVRFAEATVRQLGGTFCGVATPDDVKKTE